MPWKTRAARVPFTERASQRIGMHGTLYDAIRRAVHRPLAFGVMLGYHTNRGELALRLHYVSSYSQDHRTKQLLANSTSGRSYAAYSLFEGKSSILPWMHVGAARLG